MQTAAIDELERGSNDKLSQYQLTRINELISYIKVHSPYYAESLRNTGPLTSLSQMRDLPFTTKDDLAAADDQFTAVPVKDIRDYSTTSGTLGLPVSIALTDPDIERLGYNEMRSFQMAGATEADVFQLLTTMDKRFMAGLAYHYGARKLGAAMVRMGPGAVPLQWESIRRFKPSYLIAVPSFLPKLIDYAVDNDIDLEKSSVKNIICIGEPIRDKNLEMSNIAQQILDHWPVHLYSTYASSEMATAFTECEHGMGGHLLPELMYIEVIDKDGNHVSDGEHGEVVATPFGIQGFPLFRFKTGDICTYYTERCKCGRITPRLGPVLGRKQQLIKFKGTSLYPSSITNVLDGIPEKINYVIIAKDGHSGLDDVELLVNTNKDVAGKIEQNLHASLRVRPQVKLSTDAEIDALRFHEHSRKPSVFVDRRNREV